MNANVKCNILVMYNKIDEKVSFYIIQDDTDDWLHIKNEAINLFHKKERLNNAVGKLENFTAYNESILRKVISELDVKYFIPEETVKRKSLLLTEITSYLYNIDKIPLPKNAKNAAKLAAVKTLPLAKLIYTS